jgi:hypothetical protein
MSGACGANGEHLPVAEGRVDGLAITVLAR